MGVIGGAWRFPDAAPDRLKKGLPAQPSLLALMRWLPAGRRNCGSLRQGCDRPRAVGVGRHCEATPEPSLRFAPRLQLAWRPYRSAPLCGVLSPPNIASARATAVPSSSALGPIEVGWRIAPC